MQRRRQREWVATEIWDAEKLGDRRHLCLAIGAADTFCHVEEEVYARVGEALGKGTNRLETSDLAEHSERAGNGIDGFGCVPLDKNVGRKDLVGRLKAGVVRRDDTVRSLIVCQSNMQANSKWSFSCTTR